MLASGERGGNKDILEVHEPCEAVVDLQTRWELGGKALVGPGLVHDLAQHGALHAVKLGPEHLVHGLLLQQFPAEEGLHEDAVVARGGEQPRAAALEGVVAVLVDGRGRGLEGAVTAAAGVGHGPGVEVTSGPEGGVAHAEGQEDVGLHVLAEGLAGGGLEEEGGPVDGGAVPPALAGGELEGGGEPFPGPVEVPGGAADVVGPLDQVWVGDVVA
ncbi:unnamed protein product [Clonostachys solani]|uniref:Uncharacterized protein n=1 Tax=Clonostachys solani TaxID=160281 RepID=A0A9N9Z3Z2_9HYPO|nr:unnamed protein product [Clonostachys solani]